jgi:hypothetical protein
MISQFRQRIVFNSKTGVSDGSGGFVNTLTPYYTCWAQIAKETGGKTNISGNDSMKDDIIFRIRWAQSLVLDNKLVITFNNQKYLINSVIIEDNDYKYYLIYCASMS